MRQIKRIDMTWHYLNKINGTTASPFSACPWGAGDKDEWERVKTGYTIVFEDGTRGIGRKPFKTLDEAKKWVLNIVPNAVFSDLFDGGTAVGRQINNRPQRGQGDLK